MMKLSICSALFTIGLLGGLGASNGTAYAASNEITVSQQTVNKFSDVKTDHYAYEAIQWAKEKGIVDGYSDKNGKPNGKFGPSDAVTEAQFVKMVAGYLNLTDDVGNITKTTKTANWSDTYYDSMAKYGVPLNGYFDDKVRSTPIKRGTLAQALGYLLGDKSNLTDSINFMLDKGITQGQNPQYEGKDLYKFFGSTNNLTRSQVASFLYRMDTKSINTLSNGSASYASSTDDLNSKAKTGNNLLDRSLVDSNGDKSSSGGSGIVLIPGNNNGSTTVDNGSSNNDNVTESASYYKEKGVKLNVNTRTNHNVDNMLEFEKSISSNTLNLMNKSGLEYSSTKTSGYVFLDYNSGNGGLANTIGINYKTTKVVKAVTNEYEMLNAVLKDIFGLDIKTSNLKSTVLNMKNYSTINLGNGVTVEKVETSLRFTVSK